MGCRGVICHLAPCLPQLVSSLSCVRALVCMHGPGLLKAPGFPAAAASQVSGALPGRAASVTVAVKPLRPRWAIWSPPAGEPHSAGQRGQRLPSSAFPAACVLQGAADRCGHAVLSRCPLCAGVLLSGPPFFPVVAVGMNSFPLGSSAPRTVRPAVRPAVMRWSGVLKHEGLVSIRAVTRSPLPLLGNSSGKWNINLRQEQETRAARREIGGFIILTGEKRVRFAPV